MKIKDKAKEPQAVLEARAWKQKVSDQITRKGWDAFLREAKATTARWAKVSGTRAKAAR